MSIRPAIKDDRAAIAEIWRNHANVHTAAIWNDKTVDTDNRIAWFSPPAGWISGTGERGRRRHYRLFVWRLAKFDGFRHTVEHSVRSSRTSGERAGRKLLVALIAEARRLNKHVMVAGIESQNHASLHLHETLALSPPGRCRWAPNWPLAGFDPFMQLQLDARQDPDGKKYERVAHSRSA